MFDALETGAGLDFVLWLQSIRIPLLEALVKILDLMGEEMFYIAAIALIYWLINRSLGIRLVFILLLATVVTALAKDIISTERPYEVSALVNELVNEDTYGIPSGHVLISLAVWGYLAYRLRRAWVWALVLVYVFLQSFGRMMAGAHYPQDVVLALLLGGGTLLLYFAFAEKVAAFWNKVGNPLRIGLVIAAILAVSATVYAFSFKAPLPLTVIETPCLEGSENIEGICRKFPHFESYFTSLGLFIGSVGAVWLGRGFRVHSQVWRRLAQYLLGLLVAVGLLVLLGALADAISETAPTAYVLRTIRYAFVSFFALGLWPLLCMRFGLMEKES